MKKYITTVIASVIFILAMGLTVGCGSANEENDTAATEPPETATQAYEAEPEEPPETDIHEYEATPEDPPETDIQEYEATPQETDTATPAEAIASPEESLIGIWYYIMFFADFYIEMEWSFNAHGEYDYIERFVSLSDAVYVSSFIIKEWGTFEISGERIDLKGVSRADCPIRGENIDGYTEIDRFITFVQDGDALSTYWWDDGFHMAQSFTRVPESLVALPIVIPERYTVPLHEAFPLSYTAFNNNFTFTGYSIGIGEDGNTTITVYGSGYETLSFRDGRWAIPAVCVAESGGVVYHPVLVSNNVEALIFIFDTYFIPEIITLTNGDTGEILISFVVAP